MNDCRKHLLVVALLLATHSAAYAECRAVSPSDARWKAIDRQYATIEQATVSKNPKLLFSVYAPDFEAHQFNGQVWKFEQSAAYSKAAFEQVIQTISLSNMILTLSDCGHDTVVATVLQQWSRKQRSHAQERLFQTATVQDETWANVNGVWLRKRVDNERPAAWLVDLKRVDPSKPYNPDAPEYDPHNAKAAGSTPQ